MRSHICVNVRDDLLIAHSHAAPLMHMVNGRYFYALLLLLVNGNYPRFVLIVWFGLITNGSRRFFSCSLAVNPPIGKALAGDPAKCHRRALHIVNAKSGAGVVAEVELGHIALKVCFPYMVEGSHKPAL